MRMSRQKRGRCPQCHGTAPLRKDGGLGKHKAHARSWDKIGRRLPPVLVVCSGVGMQVGESVAGVLQRCGRCREIPACECPERRCAFAGALLNKYSGECHHCETLVWEESAAFYDGPIRLVCAYCVHLEKGKPTQRRRFHENKSKEDK